MLFGSRGSDMKKFHVICSAGRKETLETMLKSYWCRDDVSIVENEPPHFAHSDAQGIVRNHHGRWQYGYFEKEAKT